MLSWLMKVLWSALPNKYALVHSMLLCMLGIMTEVKDFIRCLILQYERNNICSRSCVWVADMKYIRNLYNIDGRGSSVSPQIEKQHPVLQC